MPVDVKRRRAMLCGLVMAVAWSVLPMTAQGPSAPAKRPLTYDAYDAWRSIEGTTLSRDGEWLAYALTAQGVDGELVVRNLRTGREFRHPRGTDPRITPDAKFVVFTIVPTKAEEEKRREQERRNQRRGEGRGAGADEPPRDQPRNSAGIMTLSTGQVATVERVGIIALPEESSTWVALHRRTPPAGGRGGRGGRGQAAGRGQGEPAEEEGRPRAKRKDTGSDLVLRNLVTGEETTVALVSEFAWDRAGTWIAYGVSSARAEEDGAFARRTHDGVTRALQKGKGNYKRFAFDETGSQLAFLSDHAEYEKPVSPYRLYYWKPADEAAAELVSPATRGMPQGMAASEHATLRFSKDGQRLYLGTAPPPPPPAAEDAPEPRQVDIWHWQDPQLQPMQRARARQERERNFAAVVHLRDRRFVQLATPDMPTLEPGEDPARAIGTSDLPYRIEVSWDASYADVFVVDIRNGQRTKVLDHFRSGAPLALSPGGRFLVYFDETQADWLAYRIADGTRANLTGRLGINFWREDHDTPSLPPAYGLAGWTDNDHSVLVYDRYDIWEIRPDGTGARMVTGGEGRKQQIVFRYRSLDPDQRAIPRDRPLLLAANEDRTEAGGFYRVALTGAASPEKLVMLDKSFGSITKAKSAERLVVTQSRFDEFPDLWATDTSFRNLQKVSAANPQQAEFVWGTTELMPYRNVDGKTLRAILAKPENFDPSKKYPLMVYIYEELSEGLHNYRAPAPGTSINVTRYVSNGYVVLLPDIVYDAGYPGESAEKCVIPAVNTVVAQGFIDPARIGIQGHSWGGYQITHLITRTNMFAAVQAGASVSNMISAYGGIRWGTGMSRAFQYEKTQSRIGAPPWDAPLQFIENSPIFWVEKVRTPYLSIHNDEDDAVPWYQGIEFFSALRRLKRQAYMFVYNGEPHGLRNRDNMKHWTVHQDEFFDHFLLGRPKPEWMEKGVPYLERGKRDVSDLFKPRVRRAETPPIQ